MFTTKPARSAKEKSNQFDILFFPSQRSRKLFCLLYTIFNGTVRELNSDFSERDNSDVRGINRRSCLMINICDVCVYTFFCVNDVDSDI